LQKVVTGFRRLRLNPAWAKSHIFAEENFLKKFSRCCLQNEIRSYLCARFQKKR
jgi:hypothetical protein